MTPGDDASPAPVAPGHSLPSRRARPVAIEGVAAILVLGGMFGLVQLLVGDFVITGRLPAKDPIIGVAIGLYASSMLLGLVVRMGRGWLPAVNLAGFFALVYLAAFGQATALILGLAHVAATLALLTNRAWFSGFTDGKAEIVEPGWRQDRAVPQALSVAPPAAAGEPEAGGTSRPSGSL